MKCTFIYKHTNFTSLRRELCFTKTNIDINYSIKVILAVRYMCFYSFSFYNHMHILYSLIIFSSLYPFICPPFPFTKSLLFSCNYTPYFHDLVCACASLYLIRIVQLSVGQGAIYLNKGHDRPLATSLRIMAAPPQATISCLWLLNEDQSTWSPSSI